MRRSSTLPYSSYVVADWLLERAFGSRVQAGPFAGLRYGSQAHWGPNVPKILGTYERELHGVLAELLACQPSTIIDVGAAEGYYAVGLARALPASRVVAFEADPTSRQLLAEMAQRNAVSDRLEILGSCTCQLFQEALANSKNPLVIMDVEGAEQELLDPTKCPSLANVPILVEVHEQPTSDLGAEITSRFQATHETAEIRQMDRSLKDLPFRLPVLIEGALGRLLRRAMNERRSYPMRWLALRPKIAWQPSPP